MQYISFFVTSAFAALPLFARAQTFRSVVLDVTGLLRALIPILAGAALLVFIGGLAQYIFQSGDQSSVKTGKNRMVAGVIGLFVISAIWGLVALLSSTLDLGVTVSLLETSHAIL